MKPKPSALRATALGRLTEVPKTSACSFGKDGLLNVAMSSGLVGVVLTLWWVFLNPLWDFNKCQNSDNDPRLALLFLQVWLFMLLYANLESPFFVGRGQIWFTLLAAVFGLRLHARMQQVVVPSFREYRTADKWSAAPQMNAAFQ